MKYLAAACLLFVLFFGGCDSDLSVSTKQWETGSDGFEQFYTNDSQYYDYYFWNLYNSINGPDTYQIECKKLSGSNKYAYGMIFGASNSVNNRYYYINITVTGSFNIYKRIGDSYTMIKDWTESDELNTGYNVINTIKVTRAGTTYTVYLNGAEVHEFTDAPVIGNRVGYIAYVGLREHESFPNTPVDVRFRQK